jgi:hypothetical protein
MTRGRAVAEVTGKILLTVTVYDGTLEDVVAALTRVTARTAILLPRDGEAEIIAAEVAGG